MGFNSVMSTAAAAAIAAMAVAAACPADAIVRSLSTFGANALRAATPEQAFSLNPAIPANVLTLPFGSLSLGTVNQFPVLGGADVQMAFVRVSLPSGSTLPAHHHPRGTEMDYIVHGTIKTGIAQEFGSDRPLVTVTASAGQLAVVPEGLIHAQTCVSHEPCVFIATFNTADPGTQLSGSSVCALSDPQVAPTLGNGLSPPMARAFCDAGVV
ncbi:hypothetical protein MMPV_002441 [Pyropia vietnamensis]